MVSEITYCIKNPKLSGIWMHLPLLSCASTADKAKETSLISASYFGKMVTWIEHEYTDITTLEFHRFLLLYSSHGPLAISICSH